MALFDISNLLFEAGGKKILNNLSFRIEKGSFTCIIGPNGAGKSTLLSCMGHLNKNYGGEVLLDGKNIARMSEKEIARRIAWLHQSGGEALPFSVREFVSLSRYPWQSFGNAGEDDRRIVENAMETAGVASMSSRRLDTLSGGERQRALLAAALAQSTDIMFLDEPASFLDYKYQEEMLALVENINRKQGITVICVTHDANFALHAADNILAVKNGSLVWSGDTDGLIAQNILGGLFETEFAGFENEKHKTVCVIPKGLLQ